MDSDNGEGGETPDEPEIPETPELPDVSDMAFYLGFANAEGAMQYLDGTTVTGKVFRWNLTSDKAMAAVFYLEYASDNSGFHVYFIKDGVKTYLNIVENGNYINLLAGAEPISVWVPNDEVEAFVVEVNGTLYVPKNYSGYTNVEAKTLDYLADQATTYVVTVFPVNSSEEPDTPDTPDQPDTPADPEADSELTIPEAIAVGAAKEHNVYTEGKYYVTGVVAEIFSETWGNMNITDSEGNVIYIYGFYSGDGAVRYDSLDVKPAVGDTVRVYGIIGKYNGTVQLKDVWLYELTPGEGSEDTPTVPEEPELPTIPAADPVVGTAYNLAFVQGNTGGIYYVNGQMASTYYLGTTENVAEAIQFYVEAAEGGYYLYGVIDGNKTYLNVVVSGTHVNSVYGGEASTVYTYDSELKTLVADVDGVAYVIGTRNDMSYTTLGPVKVANEPFYAHLTLAFDSEGGEEIPETPETPDAPENPELPDMTGMAFYLGFANAEGAMQYLDGTTVTGKEFRWNLTSDEAMAAVFYMEDAGEGSYYFYFMKDGVKTYLNIVENGNYINLLAGDTAISKWIPDFEVEACVVEVNGKLYAPKSYGGYNNVEAKTLDYVNGDTYFVTVYFE